MTDIKNPPETWPCRTCGSEALLDPMSRYETIVGYSSPPGHDHDDNCLSYSFKCEYGHHTSVYMRRQCPLTECDWVGKDSCPCHPGRNLELPK